MFIVEKFRDIADSILILRHDLSIMGADYFILKARLIRQTLEESGAIRKVRTIILIIVSLAAIAVVVAWLYSQPWSGFYSLPSSTGTTVKTLWDWLELLIIPLFLAGVAFWLRQSEVTLSNQQSLGKSRDDALNSYFQQIQSILLGTDLSDKEAKQTASNIASARTVMVLRTLDPSRKMLVFYFLYEAGLISGDDPFINLESGDLSHIYGRMMNITNINLERVDLLYADIDHAQFLDASLSGANLYRADMSFFRTLSINLDYAILEQADLYYADLSNASLHKAKAQRANFARCNLEQASLDKADLEKANLRKANLKNASLQYADLTYANLSGANLNGADLSEANLMHANLKGVDLSGANLTNAIVSKAQLRRAKSSKAAILDGIRDRITSPEPTKKD